MIRYDDKHVSVRISDEGLRRAYGDNQLLLIASSERSKWYVEVAVWIAAIALGFVMAYSAANGA